MGQFTTVTKVREVAGFVGNSNISDAQISSYIDVATSQVESKISDAYQIPLPKFFENTITFSGTGSGSGTMTITIAGINYAISITNGLTASAAADLFRTAVNNEANATFIVDKLGSGVVVTINTCDRAEDPLDVTITSTDPQTVSGITSTGGTVIEVTIAFLENITAQIAAAYLLIQEYGPEAQDIDKDGFKRLAIFDGDAETPGLLEQVKMQDMKLFDCAGNELPNSSTQKADFFPTEASREDEENPTDNAFTKNQLF